MTSRNKRASKVVDYCALQNGFSDEDDFANFTPPSKKKKETKREMECDKENQTLVSDDVVEDVIKTSKKRSPKERVSIEERKFQRDLELALELSSTNRCSEKDFQGFKEKTDTDDDEADVESSVTEVEIHAIPSEEETRKLKADAVQQGEKREARTAIVVDDGLHSSDQEIVACSPREEPLPAKRQRKKVNFVEDDDSDEWSSDQKQEEDSESESDESDFLPSPQKKTKKETKPVKTKDHKGKTNDSTIKTNVPTQRKPLKVKQDLPAQSPSLTTPRSPVLKSLTKPYSPIITSKTISPKPLKKLVPSTPKSTPTQSIVTKNDTFTPKSISSNSNIGVTGTVKKPFKSPSLGGGSSSPSPSRIPPSSSSGGIGLRLGLSRKMLTKPLHPKLSSIK